MAVENKIEKIEIVGEFNILQIKEVQTITSQGQSATTFMRRVVTPVDDVSNDDPQIAALASVLWTDDVRAAYASHIREKVENAGPAN